MKFWICFSKLHRLSPFLLLFSAALGNLRPENGTVLTSGLSRCEDREAILFEPTKWVSLIASVNTVPVSADFPSDAVK